MYLIKFMNCLDKVILVSSHCLFLLSCYTLSFIILSLNYKFRDLHYSKQLYIIKNFIKSFILCYMSIATYDILLQVIYDNPFNNIYIYHYSSLYVCNDIMALFIVPNLPFTTKVHHSITTTLLFYSLSIDYNNNILGKLILIYTFFSCYSFLVNFYLGLRYFYNDLELNNKKIEHLEKINQLYINNVIDIVRISAFYNYLYSCIINWTIHIMIFGYRIYNNTFDIYHLVYICLLKFIITDDLILMKWLYKKTINA